MNRLKSFLFVLLVASLGFCMGCKNPVPGVDSPFKIHKVVVNHHKPQQQLNGEIGAGFLGNGPGKVETSNPFGTFPPIAITYEDKENHIKVLALPLEKIKWTRSSGSEKLMTFIPRDGLAKVNAVADPLKALSTGDLLHVSLALPADEIEALLNEIDQTCKAQSPRK